MSGPLTAQPSGWLVQALATDAPALPTAGAMQVWLHLGWSVVLAWLGVWLMARLMPQRVQTRPVQWLVGLCLAVWAWLPGPTGAAYWLGLAFQAPSASGVLLCVALLVARWRETDDASGTLRWSGSARSCESPALWLAGLAALLGWALLLDSFAVLPVQLYAWGFSPAALFLVVSLSLLPWVFGGYMAQTSRMAACGVVPLAALVFVVWRLPSGNVWDAVLDPWVWVALQVWLLRRSWSCYKNSSQQRLFHEG
jgi:hypothetical protein